MSRQTPCEPASEGSTGHGPEPATAFAGRATAAVPHARAAGEDGGQPARRAYPPASSLTVSTYVNVLRNLVDTLNESCGRADQTHEDGAMPSFGSRVVPFPPAGLAIRPQAITSFVGAAEQTVDVP